ncbi:MAG TPA: DUF2142 domain-containing protein [Anaerolineae bacterium]|nr:DUF2142 domain-containing protein [Anaerolineae bacterium]
MDFETKKREYGPIVLLMLLFVGIAGWYSMVNPPFEATDEIRHYRFVRYISENKSLPVQGEEACRSQSHHPPLIYVVAAVVTGWIETGQDLCYTPEENPFWAYRYWEVGVDNKNQFLPQERWEYWSGEALAVHLARLVNVVVGALTVGVTWYLGRLLWPERRWWALTAAAVVGFNPMFLYMAGAINNDVMAALTGTAVLAASAQLAQDEAGLSRRWGMILGGLYGLALMSKFNLAPVVLLPAVVMTWVAWRRGTWRVWAEAVGAAVVMSVAVAGWWFIRNLMLYGEPTGVRAVTELWGVRDPRDSFWLAVSELPYAWSSLWGRFGFGQIPLPAWFYAGLWWGMVLMLVGWLGRFGRERFKQEPLVWGLLVADVVMMGAVLFNYMLISPAGPMGRFFFPGLPALACLAVGGLGSWWRGRERPVAVVGVVMAGLALWALLGYLAPAYGRPASWTEAALVNETQIQFDGLVQLRGYEIGEQVRAGGKLDITLYWEVVGQPPGNYLMFVHLIDEAGVMVAQRDTHPGLGRFPSRNWRVGDRFVEEIEVALPVTAYTDVEAALSVGFYVPGAYRLGITDVVSGEGLGDALVLGEVAVLAGETGIAGAWANPLRENFGETLLLVDYGYGGDERVYGAGERMVVEMVWRSLAGRAEGDDYVVEVRLTDGSGNLRLARQEVIPVGDEVVTSVELILPEDLEVGGYGVSVAVLVGRTTEQLSLVGDGGELKGERLELGGIRVE